MSKVLLHSLVFSPDSVSTAFVMTDLAVELRRLGHAVTVLTTTPHYNLDQQALARQTLVKRWGGLLYFSEFDGMPVWHVKLPMKGNRLWARGLDYVRFHMLSLAASVWALGPQDIVIATSPPLTIGLIAWILGLRWKAPAVYKVAELYPDLAMRQGVIRSAPLIGLMRWIERLVYSRNAMIVPICEQFAMVIRGRGVHPKKVCTIPDFVDVELFRPLPRNNEFSKIHQLDDLFIVLYGGNIGLVQDWESVLYAAERLQHLPICFIIVGNGSRREWLAQEILRRKLPNMRLLGYQPRQLMPIITASCDLATIPMTRTGAQDGFPSKIYSILASGRPVIVSAAADSEMATLVKRAGSGWAVPPEDPEAFTNAVLQAYQHRELLPELGRNGRRHVEADYSKEAVAARYDALIRDLTFKNDG